jgi:hypothetical protein
VDGTQSEVWVYNMLSLTSVETTQHDQERLSWYSGVRVNDVTDVSGLNDLSATRDYVV